MAGSLDALNRAFLCSSLDLDAFSLVLNRAKLKLYDDLSENEEVKRIDTVKSSQEFYEIAHFILDRYLVLDYKNISTIGGKIFFCMDLWDRTPCVIKEIPAKFAVSVENAETNKVHNSKQASKQATINEILNRFYGANSEAKYFAKLPFHNNVVRLLRVEIIGTSILLVQEWLPSTLSDLLVDSNLQLSPKKIVDITFSTCCGLEHCIKHLTTPTAKYFHGDIKPENIFVSRDGTFKIADFGGGYTEGYASPELMKFFDRVREVLTSSTLDSSLLEDYEVIDFRTDIFSIGKILEKLCKICDNLAFKDKAIEFAKICSNLLCTERPQSIQEIYDTLEKILDKNNFDDNNLSENNGDISGFRKSQKIDKINTSDKSDNSWHSDSILTTEQVLNLVLIAEISQENQGNQENDTNEYLKMLRSVFNELTRLSQTKNGDAEDAINKENAKNLYYAGEILMHINRPDEALRMYSSVLKQGFNHAILMAGMAKAFFRLSDWDSSIKYSRAAIELMLEDYQKNPDINPLNYNSIGIYINSLFNIIVKNVSQSQDCVIQMPEYIDSGAFEWILSILELLRVQQPTRKEPLLQMQRTITQRRFTML